MDMAGKRLALANPEGRLAALEVRRVAGRADTCMTMP
jgi:hypothetical protein